MLKYSKNEWRVLLMNISENVKYIANDISLWRTYTNRRYKVKVQKADKNKIYNVAGQTGIVYNIFEDSYAKVNENGLVVTGVAGEMWPIGEKALKKYNVSLEQLSYEPIEVETIETGIVFCGVPIPKEVVFTLEANYGEKVILKGNRPDIEHGGGDYILVAAKLENGKYIPDFTDSGRVVNGTIFDKLYKEV